MTFSISITVDTDFNVQRIDKDVQVCNGQKRLQKIWTCVRLRKHQSYDGKILKKYLNEFFINPT